MKIGLTLVLLILLSSLVIAQEEFDYESAAAYGDPYFLQNSNPADWNLDYVDFSNPSIWDNPQINQLLGRSELYTNNNFYDNFDNIPSTNYDLVKWEETQFGTMDLNKIDWVDPSQLPDSFHSSLAGNHEGLGNYLHTIGNGGTIKMDEKRIDKVRFDGRGIQNLDAYVVLEECAAGANIEVRGINIFVTLPTKEQLGEGKYKGAESWSEGKVPSLSKDNQVVFIFPAEFEEGEKFKVGENDIPVEGELYYKDGEWHTRALQKALINGVEIRAEEVVPVYGLSDGDLSKKYLALENDEKLKQVYNDFDVGIFLGEEGFVAKGVDERARAYTLDFKKDNPYTEIEEKDGQEFGDRLEVTPLKGGLIFDGDDYIAAGSLEMKNGHREIGFREGHVYSRGVVYEKEHDSVPMEIELLKEDLTKPDYARLADVENVIDINDENKVEFGKTSHLSVMVDPHKLLGLESDTLEVVDNLDKTAVKKPFFIVAAPGHSKEDRELFDKTIKIMEENVRGDYYPVVLRLENEEKFIEILEEQALQRAYGEAITPAKVSYVIDYEQEERRATHRTFINSLDQKELSEYEFRIVGHSTVGHTPIERFGVAVAGLDIGPGGIVIDSQVKISDKKIDNLLGCAVADKMVNEWGFDRIKNKVESGEFKAITTDEFSNKWMESGCAEIDRKCVLNKLGYDVLYEPGVPGKEDFVKDLGSEASDDVWGYVKSQSQEKANEELYEVVFHPGQLRPSEVGIQDEALLLFAAMETAKINLKEEIEKPLSVRELMVAVETQEIRFPDCASARTAEKLVFNSYGLRLNYLC